MASKPFEKACNVVAEQGEVEIDGLPGVTFSLTPRAALETADRLMAAAAQAAGQNAMREAALRTNNKE